MVFNKIANWFKNFSTKKIGDSIPEPVDATVEAWRCRVCGRPLINPESRRVGMGKTCQQRHSTNTQ